jgi:hypothetical protein
MMNPRAVDEEELMAGLIDKGVICATGPGPLYIFILRASLRG